MRKNHWSNYRGLNIKIGLILSLGVTLLAFEWKTYNPPALVDLGQVDPWEDLETPPPITEQIIPPPPPKVVLPKIVEVPEEEIIDEIDPGMFDVEIDIETAIPDTPEEVEEIEEPIEGPPFVYFAEQSAEPEGGIQAFHKYLKKNLDYPRQAKRMGVQGKVIMEFIVDTDGAITEVKVLRGIGGGCDEEAKRLIEDSPKWKPGKQRGRPVRQKMTLPIFFKLN